MLKDIWWNSLTRFVPQMQEKTVYKKFMYIIMFRHSIWSFTSNDFRIRTEHFIPILHQQVHNLLKYSRQITCFVRWLRYFVPTACSKACCRPFSVPFYLFLSLSVYLYTLINLLAHSVRVTMSCKAVPC